MIGKCEHCGTLFGPTEKRCEACGAPLPLVELWGQPGHQLQSDQPAIMPYNGGTWEAGSYSSATTSGTVSWRVG